MFLEVFQFFADLNQSFHHTGILVNTHLIGTEHFFCGGNLETAHFHQIIHRLDVLYVLRRILANVVTRGFRLERRNLLLPETKVTLRHTHLLSHFLDREVEFQVLVCIQCHNNSTN